MENVNDENIEETLELRMYFFVPYNISEIQKGIQAGHAALRYARMFNDDISEIWDFVDNHETWIILNGGTTNETRDFDGKAEGTINQIADSLADNDIPFSYFIEPDLNNALSALCFICDERVFNYEDYPDLKEFLNIKIGDNLYQLSNEELIEKLPEEYKEWVRFLGGVKNVFLRELIKGKKLA